MPSSSQTRSQRITLLVEYGLEKFPDTWIDVAFYDYLLREARRRWPMVREVTLKDYAKAALMVLEAKKDA